MGCNQSSDAVIGKKVESSGGGGGRRLVRGAIGKSQRLLLPTRNKNEDAFDTCAPPLLDDAGNLLPEEIAKRTIKSVESKSYTVGDKERGLEPFLIKYAYLSMRGYYPFDASKPNQDAFLIQENFGGVKGDLLLTVFDGHGKEGHKCAKFAKKKLPNILSKHMKSKRMQRYKQQQDNSNNNNSKMWPILEAHEMKDLCTTSCLECNKAMQQDAKIPEELSGTTAISALFHGGRLTVCNVGDSRAILGHRVTKTQDTAVVVALPLSRDQTPYRPDERERVKKAGARVMSLYQMEGYEPLHEDWDDANPTKGDPPRVWSRDADYPGTAFTRSLGDTVAESCGVYALPEVVSTELTSNDEVLVVASDGVFEFLSSQAVIDMCREFHDPLDACKRILDASYEQWMNHERRTDDITMIVAFIQCNRTPPLSNNDDDGTTTEALVHNNNRPIFA